MSKTALRHIEKAIGRAADLDILSISEMGNNEILDVVREIDRHCRDAKRYLEDGQRSLRGANYPKPEKERNDAKLQKP